MKTLTYTKAHHLPKLNDELMAAIPLLQPVAGESSFTLNGDGMNISMSVPDAVVNAEVTTVVNAHDPTPPKIFEYGAPITPRRVVTTNGGLVEIFRGTVPQNTVFKAQFTLWGSTDNMLNVRIMEAIITVGRATGNVVIIQRNPSGNTTVIADHAGGAGSTWPAPTVSVDNSGSNRAAVIQVSGVAGTTIRWLLTGRYDTFTPGGA